MGRLKLQTRKTRSPLSVHIGNQLLKARQKHAVTMRQLSEESGLSNAFICQIENGQSCPTADTLWTLSKYFEVRADYWFRGFNGDEGS